MLHVMVLGNGFVPLEVQLFEIYFLLLEYLFSTSFLAVELYRGTVLELLQAFAW